MRRAWTNLRRAGCVVMVAGGIITIPGMQCMPTGTGELQPDMDILSASIAELPPFASDDVVNRKVMLQIELAGAPTCGIGGTAVIYGFLIDDDNDPNTGVSEEFTEPLGVDARVSVECDPVTGEFFSPLGPVTVSGDPDTGSTNLTIETTVGLLPSVDFSWVAFVDDESSFVRLPDVGDNGTWSTIEISLP